jgi:predicted membrane protein
MMIPFLITWLIIGILAVVYVYFLVREKRLVGKINAQTWRYCQHYKTSWIGFADYYEVIQSVQRLDKSDLKRLHQYIEWLMYEKEKK